MCFVCYLHDADEEEKGVNQLITIYSNLKDTYNPQKGPMQHVRDTEVYKDEEETANFIK